MKIVVIDGQGGKMGCAVIAAVKRKFPGQAIYGIGTNSIATAAMLKAGADYGATGENPVVVACRDADVVIGPLGIVIADSLTGEVTPKMACAVGQSRAYKLFLPVNRCNHWVAGTENLPLGEYICQVVERLAEWREEQENGAD